MNAFFQDIWRGLNASPKYLSSKYFYDEAGDAIFREIMACPEYYLTKCELDIFCNQAGKITDAIIGQAGTFDVVELGPGDASKSTFLLTALWQQAGGFTYYPIDISENVIHHLHEAIPASVPGIKVQGLNGEYFSMLEGVKEISARNKLVLFLGSSIGNVPIEDTVGFFRKLKGYLVPGDLVLTGFDLKKAPAVILAAYNDSAGITKRFNLNLLRRINDTLDADFDLSLFEHRPIYNEDTGACKSYLVSTEQQRVRIGEVGWIHFQKGEAIYMEISQKFTAQQIDVFAPEAGFTRVQNFYDSKKWFVDALWRCD